MPHIERTAETLEQIVTIASEFRDQRMNHADMAILPWFRGQANAEWPLKPKFYRTPPIDLNVEKEIREEFITHAPAFGGAVPRNEWEWYFLMQHYGVPTRLLDWTDGVLIALYFAIRDNSGLHHAAVWALDPWWLNWKVIRKDEVVPVGDPVLPGLRREQRWLPMRFGRRTALPKSPIAVFPGHFDKRIGAQRSAFTVHGEDLDGLMTLANADKDAGLVKIIIPSWCVRQIKRSLDTCGIDETTVFPNLEALSRIIEFRWKNEPRNLPHHEVLTRLEPSKIHGVGVFALRDIPSGKKLFGGDITDMMWIDLAAVKRQPAQIKKLYEDFGVLKDGRYGCPSNFNRLTMSWYLNNDSKHPNVSCDSNYDFTTLRKIKAGEELTVDYSTYP